MRRRRAFSARNLLVVSQMAGSLTLLLVTGYIVFGMERTMLGATGFDAGNIQLISVDPIRDGYSVSQAEEFYPKLLDHVKTMPEMFLPPGRSRSRCSPVGESLSPRIRMVPGGSIKQRSMSGIRLFSDHGNPHPSRARFCEG